MLIAYSTYTKRATALQQLQTAYATEQAKTKKLTQKADELLKALEESQRASGQEQGQLEAKATKLATAFQQVQTAYATEQAKTKKLTQKADELLKALEQAQTRVKALEESQRASGQEQGQLEAKAAKLATAFQQVQTAYATEQAKTKKLTQKADELLKALEQAQTRVKALEESHRASGQEQGQLEAKAAKRATAVQELQTAHATEQAKTKKSTQEMADTLELVSRFGADIVALYHTIGISYNMLGMNEEALKAFQMAVELDPNHAESHFDLARVYIEYLDDSESAVPHFRRYVQLRPEAEDAERIRGWLMKAEKELKVKQEWRRWGRGFFLRER
jgi:tetratricopeptide (TPR) repeat protein